MSHQNSSADRPVVQAPLAQTWMTALRRSLVWVLALTILGALAGGLASAAQTKTYQATTELMLMPTNGKDSTDLNNSTGVAQSLVSSYSQAALSTQVLQAALADAHSTRSVSDLAGTMTATVPSGTVVIDLSVTDHAAADAAALANAVAHEFVQQAPTLMPRLTSGSVIMQPVVLRPATVPSTPSSLGLRVLVPVGAFLGFALGLAWAVWRRRPAGEPAAR